MSVHFLRLATRLNINDSAKDLLCFTRNRVSFAAVGLPITWPSSYLRAFNLSGVSTNVSDSNVNYIYSLEFMAELLLTSGDNSETASMIYNFWR